MPSLPYRLQFIFTSEICYAVKYPTLVWSLSDLRVFSMVFIYRTSMSDSLALAFFEMHGLCKVGDGPQNSR